MNRLGFVIKNQDECKFHRDGDYYSYVRRKDKEPIFLDIMHAKIYMYEESALKRIDVLKKLHSASYVVEEF